MNYDEWKLQAAPEGYDDIIPCKCPECSDLLESENELIRYYSTEMKRTMLTCIKCKQQDDEYFKL